MLKAIIFDLDGTLLNTLDDISDAVNYTLKHFNYKPKEKEEIRSYLGYGANYLLTKSLNNNLDNFDEILTFYKNYLEKNSRNMTKPYDGIEKVLKKLKEKYVLAVVSNKHQEAVSEVINYYFKDTFEVVIGEREGILKKPAPDLLNLALNKLNINSDEAIYIGDSEVDLKTAQNALLKSILVSWGFREYHYLNTLNFDYLIKEPKEILKIIGE
ncbi:MAG: HAD family hydrolase [Acholeplasmataceae bacterium]